MKIAITGHRPNKLGNDYDLTSPLLQAIKGEINKIVLPYGKPTYITGMALGIDTLFALMAIENDCPFIAAIPCRDQEKMWIKKSKDLYNKILSSSLCTKVFVTDGAYSNTVMQVRNKWMVDNSDVLISVWDGSEGGTANCTRYAQYRNKFIIQINPAEVYVGLKLTDDIVREIKNRL